MAKRRRNYPNVEPGQWVRPKRRGYRMACCDCGLVHVMNFDVLKKAGKSIIFLQAFRDERATAAIRREARKKFESQRKRRKR